MEEIKEFLTKYPQFEDKFNESNNVEEFFESIVEYFESVISCMPGNVYWLGRDGRTISCNKNVADMFGFDSVDQFRNLTFEQMGKIGKWSEDATVSFEEDSFEVLQTGKAKLNIEEFPIQHSNGKLIYFLSHRVPLIDKKGKVMGVVGISIDITERKRMEAELMKAKERAEAANKAKSIFIANMSHDIRTPLAGIIGISKLLQRDDICPKDREFAVIIHKSGEKLLSLLNDVLSLASANESHEEALKEESFILHDRIKHIENIFMANAELKNINLIISADDNLPYFVISDRIKIDRILLNLVSNALKFTEKGKILLKVNRITSTKNKVLVEFIIQDTGIGIPSSKIDHIFERFYKVESSSQEKDSGFGIGLFIVKHYVDLLKGKHPGDQRVR